jgi:hypothetical protein
VKLRQITRTRSASDQPKAHTPTFQIAALESPLRRGDGRRNDPMWLPEWSQAASSGHPCGRYRHTGAGVAELARKTLRARNRL